MTAIARKVSTLISTAVLSACLGQVLLAQTALAQVAGTGTGVDSAPLVLPPATVNLPDMGSGANALITRTDEFQIGRMMVHNLRQENLILEDPESTEYLQNLGTRIGAEAQEGNQAFNFFIVRDRSINAFAVPGGFIGANVGLILMTNTESELAGVLAHEIGHVVQRHIARAVQAQSSVGLLAGCSLSVCSLWRPSVCRPRRACSSSSCA